MKLGTGSNWKLISDRLVSYIKGVYYCHPISTTETKNKKTPSLVGEIMKILMQTSPTSLLISLQNI